MRREKRSGQSLWPIALVVSFVLALGYALEPKFRVASVPSKPERVVQVPGPIPGLTYGTKYIVQYRKHGDAYAVVTSAEDLRGPVEVGDPRIVLKDPGTVFVVVPSPGSQVAEWQLRGSMK
jgi:hypothetical protein